MQETYDNLISQLESLRQKGESITLYDISAVLDNITRYFGNNKSELNTLFLQDEIVKIANHIEITKQELASLTPEKPADNNISQLEAVIKATEEAATTILDAADEVQRIINHSGASQETKDKIVEATTRIYEACNFQDLAGQRIIRVMRELEFVEAKIHNLIMLFSDNSMTCMRNPGRVEDTRPDSHLLNGPQLPGNAPAQADVDAMFNNIRS